MSELAITLPLYISFMLAMHYGLHYPLFPITLFPFSPNRNVLPYNATIGHRTIRGAVLATLGTLLVKLSILSAVRHASTYDVISAGWKVNALFDTADALFDTAVRILAALNIGPAN